MSRMKVYSQPGFICRTEIKFRQLNMFSTEQISAIMELFYLYISKKICGSINGENFEVFLLLSNQYCEVGVVLVRISPG